MATLLRVMTFNVNGLSDYEGPPEFERVNTWANRAPFHRNLIARWSPDIIGLQEVTDDALATYRSQLAGYALVTGNRYGDTPPQEQTLSFGSRIASRWWPVVSFGLAAHPMSNRATLVLTIRWVQLGSNWRSGRRGHSLST